MIKLYYARPSLFSRPVWLALLEKQLCFELMPVNLGGDQFEPEFLALSPFAHIPVLVDDDFRVIESLAILDYLEAKYPNPSLLPKDATEVAQVRMVQLITFNELLPAIVQLMIHDDAADLKYAQFRISTTLNVLAKMLGDRTYFAGGQLTLAEIVAGTLIPTLPELGIELTAYAGLTSWSERLLARPSWQTIQLSAEERENFKRHLKVMPKVWQRRRRQRMKTWSLTLQNSGV